MWVSSSRHIWWKKFILATYSWEINQETHYFVFTVLPFGLSTATFVINKVVRPLIKYWRLYAIRIACFLDDGLSIEFGYSKSETSSKFVRNTLINARFVTNKVKSVWESTKTLTSLGMSVDLNKECRVFPFPKNVFQIY